jgi:hypothetical protein
VPGSPDSRTLCSPRPIFPGATRPALHPTPRQKDRSCLRFERCSPPIGGSCRLQRS